jgi:hypothetical protein
MNDGMCENIGHDLLTWMKQKCTDFSHISTNSNYNLGHCSL